jgi:hypothetical protein
VPQCDKYKEGSNSKDIHLSFTQIGFGPIINCLLWICIDKNKVAISSGNQLFHFPFHKILETTDLAGIEIVKR